MIRGGALGVASEELTAFPQLGPLIYPRGYSALCSRAVNTEYFT